ncbi:MAG: ATP-binding protein, partial [Eubacterium sp.]|nr:ATP-binding protein [Eubacterium sp.]
MDRTTIENLANSTEQKYNHILSVMAEDCIDSSNLQYDLSNEYLYYKVNGIANSWEDLENGISQLISTIIIGLHSSALSVSFIVLGDGNDTNIYVGVNIDKESVRDNGQVLLGLLSGNLPAINIDTKNNNYNEYKFAQIVNSNEFSSVGFIKGNPSILEKGSQLDFIINGIKGKKWCYIVNAIPLTKNETITHQKLFLDESSKSSMLNDVSFSDTDNVENTSYKKTYFAADKYNELMEQYSEKYNAATNVGEWAVTIQYGTTNESDAALLSGLLVSLYYGTESTPEPVHQIKGINARLSEGILENIQTDIIENFGYPILSTFLNSKELAIYMSFPTKDTAGFSVFDYTEFDVSRFKSGPLSLGKIIKNGTLTENEYSIDYNELNRHCLIVGLTGSGKTNTTKNILHNVYEGSEHTIPIMVIEPAKKEYWELYKLGFDDLQIHTVGSSNPLCNPYCLNPFECIGNTALQTHIDNVYAAFKASFIMYTPMPYVLERAIYEIYEDYGWDLRTNKNRKGTDLYPTVEDLYWKIPAVVTAMGYDQKMRNDLIGSLQARINSLRLGSKGDTLNVRKSFPISEILKKNVVIELEDIGDDDVKAFIISMMLIQLVELRRQEEDCQLSVKHLLLIEEAHRLLKNVGSGTGENADPRGAAVEFFCNLLAELRSKGQGFLVADQIPSKLAPDLIKNTNIKIVHRTVDKEDRELMGGAMHMTDEQTDYLSSLKMGESAIYSESDNRPKLIKPNYAGKYVSESKAYLKVENDVLPLVRNNCYLANGENNDYTSLTGCNVLCRLCKPYCTK